MDKLTDSIFNKLGASLVEDFTCNFPNPRITHDAHVKKAKKHVENYAYWDAFHHFAFTHSTVLYQEYHYTQNAKIWFANLEQNEKLRNKVKLENINHPITSEETKRLIQSLPSEWTIVQITAERQDNVANTGWPKFGDPPTVPDVYISRVKCGKFASVINKEVFTFNMVKSFTAEVDELKKENKLINSEYGQDAHKYNQKRLEINDRMMTLVRSMEISWLKYWTCLFSGSLSSENEKKVRKMVLDVLNATGTQLTPEQLEIFELIASVPPSSHDCVIKIDYPVLVAISKLLDLPLRDPKVKSLSLAVMDLHKNIKDIVLKPRNPVILILDKSIVTLPWEMISPLQNQPVTRMPSFHSLVQLYKHHLAKPDSLLNQGINPKNGFYVLDPDDNLPRTKNRLQSFFENSGWDGFIGSYPTHQNYQGLLMEKDIYVYSGHGSGTQYLPSELITRTLFRSLVMLYGCSSVSMKNNGFVTDPWGVINSYILGNCPCVVGMLWEVMDKDTDRLTKEISAALIGQESIIKDINFNENLKNSNLDQNLNEDTKNSEQNTKESYNNSSNFNEMASDSLKGTYFPLVISKAKPFCSWYFIAASLVVYGLPLKIVRED